MDEQKTNTVTIPLNEYMDLIRNADFNQMLLCRFMEWEGRMSDFDRRVFELEARIPKTM